MKENICLFTKLYNQKTGRYFIVDALHFSFESGQAQVSKVAMLDLNDRTRRWRPVEEIEGLIELGTLKHWSCIDL